MASIDSSYDFFRDAHSKRLDITNSYLALGDVPDLVGVSVQNEEKIIQAVRRLLEQDGGGISKVSDLAEPYQEPARELYQSDQIAAVDGTDAISALRFVSDTLYAAGVVAVTPRSRHQPRARVTRTRASSYASMQDFSKSWDENIRNWGTYLRGARENEISWVSTFREYEERELAYEWLQEDSRHVALIDGPVLTQNLLSQVTARDLLERILVNGRAIGFIKEISANPLLVAIGCALEPGEVFVLAHWSNLLSERFSSGQEAIASWINDRASRVVRAIYKLNRKAYGIECVRDLVPLALAILGQDPGGSAEHDIPMLLQIADLHVRSHFNGASAREEVLARHSLRDPDRFLELTYERDLR
ncbi:MAG: hypothetical protein OXE05_03785 [Chloroflexi bacterium]|nr:hypothetical protein [Chloroflexota bacterium]